jgi:SchA/CurD like domain
LSQWLALRYDLKPGSEDAVKRIFEESGHPDPDVRDDDGNVIGKLIITLVFLGPELAVRVMEMEGTDFRAVAKHIGRQPEVAEFEKAIEPHLAVARDLSTPEGSQKFFRDAALHNILTRRRTD